MIGAEALLQAAPVGLVAVDADRRVTALNPAAEALLNIGARTAIGTTLDRLLALPAEVSGALGSDAPVAAYRQQGPKGTTLDLHLSPLDEPGATLVTLYPHGAGEPRERTQAAVGIAAMLAHEIKNPLAGIRGAAQLLEGEGATIRLTRLIRDEVDRLARLIDRMESFTDERPLVRGARNIHAILAHAVDAMRAAQGDALRINEAYDPSLPPVLVEFDSMAQVLLNLLVNAAEASPTGAEVTLATRYRPGVTLDAESGRRRLSIELSVIDEGPGPPPTLIPHLFQPFVSSKAMGRGIGLALVDKLVRDNGGLVQFAREDGRTVFRILLEAA